MAENKSAPPSHNPADDDSLPGMMAFVLKKFLQGEVDDMLPARVIAYDRASNRACVQPLIAMVTTAGVQVERQQVASIPVFQFGGGNCMLSFNLRPGDLGWIKANDRDISLFLANYNDAPPNTERLHDFADALFFPDVMRNYTINAEDDSHAVLQTTDGSQRIALWPDKVKITATEILADTPIFTVTGIFNVLNQNGEANPCNITGDINTTGNVFAQQDVTAGSISLQHHTHSGVQPGGGNTGQPNP